MTYPLRFRQHIFKVRAEEGLNDSETARRFHIGLSSLKGWAKNPEPVKQRNRKTRIDMAALAEDVKAHPDDYQFERAARFGMSRRGMCGALKRLGLSRKKTLRHPKADIKAREVFVEKITRYESAGNPIVHIDESGFAVDMPRCYGYSRKGQRCHGQQDWQAKGRINVIGALHENQLLTACLFESTVDSDVFHAWVTKDLLHKLSQDTVIVMDNATFHKRQDTQQQIQQAGYILEYLPPYSTDLNPIEQKWAQAKACRRKYPCDVETLLSSAYIDSIYKAPAIYSC